MYLLQPILFLSTLLVFSCSSDDDVAIIGTWTLTSVEATCPPDSSIDSQTLNATNSCFSIEEDTQCMTVIFGENGIATFDVVENGESFQAIFSYTVMNESEVELCFQNDPSECIPITLNASRLSFPSNLDECETNFIFEKK